VKHSKFYFLLAVVMIFSFILVACGPAATPAPAAQPTKAPEAAKPAGPDKEIPFAPKKVEAPNCDYGGEFKSIESVDAKTVKFTLCNPDPAFASKVAFSVFAIADSAVLDYYKGDSVKMSDAPVGTGPYIMKEWKRGDSVTYEANPNYWGEKAKVKKLIFKWSEQSAQRKLELESGTVDGIDNPAPEDFKSIEGNSNLKLYARDPLNIFYIGFNNTIKPFDNEKVRQAIAYAIDRQRIVDSYMPEGSKVADVFVPPAIKPGYSDGQKWYDYDPAKAKQLLADAGYKDGLEITLSFRNVVRAYLATPDKVAQEIQGQLKEVGIKVNLKQMESAAFIDATAAGQEGFYLLGWNADYPDATNFYDYHFATPQNKQFGKLYDDVVKDIKAAAQLADAAERQKHYDKVNELLKTYVPMIPVSHAASATAFKANVTGAHASPLGNENFAVMGNGTDQMVWLQNGEPAALWCTDETDGETLRACEQIYESLLAFKVGGTEVIPSLANKYESTPDATQWTFTLNDGIKFQNGFALDATDVVDSYVALWDAKSPNHKGRTTTFEYFGSFFGSFLNAAK
jgi:peptide/nickel transport system substrate-binding protein